MIISAGKNVKVHPSVKAYGKNQIGKNSIILEDVYLGYPTTKILLKIGETHLDFTHAKFKGCIIGKNAIIRSNSVIYSNVKMGNNVRTGHGVLIRENCTIGSHVMIGTNSVIENNSHIGSHVSIQSNVFIPAQTKIGDYVFMGPCVVLANDKYPVRIKRSKYIGPTLEKGVSLGAGSVILPGITIGEGSLVASNSVVTKDVPKWHLAMGAPAKMVPLKQKLRKLNKII
ncbi:MAG: N-acetyltransferase [Candidatus Omnitrophica bacterium]|nr:N-acetyltransferase [Candidatus Omnitrophota bacterium]